MDHETCWKFAKPIEPEQTRFVGTFADYPSPIPDFLIVAKNDDGSYDIFVTRPPEPPLPRSKFVVIIDDCNVGFLLHCGTQECQTHHLQAIIEFPYLSELFLGAHEVIFGDASGRPMSIEDLAAIKDPASPLTPEAYWIRQAALWSMRKHG